MAGRWNRATPTEANGKAKTENGNEKRERCRRKKIVSPHRHAKPDRPVSPDGTHSLEGRRDGRGAMDGSMDGERSGTQ